MDDTRLLVSSSSERSGRTALLVRERDSVWMYLTKPESVDVERDCWLFNTPEAPPEPDLAAYENEAPPAPAALTTGDAVRQAGAIESWELVWSDDGETISASMAGALLGVIDSACELGYSTHLARECEWGLPLDEDTLERLFPLSIG